MELSIVSTLYCSEAYVEEFYRRAVRTAERITPDFEIILVNDGSPDDSLRRAVNLWEGDTRLRVIDLSRNFGHHRAMMTGLAHARGDLVFLIDCDLEEDPELLEEYHRELRRTRADVVYGVQKARKGGWFERLTGRLFFAVFNLLSTDPIPTNVVVGRLMTSRYVKALVSHREREVLIAGLWSATGFEQRPLPIDKKHKGASTYDLRRKVAHLVNAITSFSNLPLVWIFYVGLVMMAVSGAAGLYLIVRRLFFDVLLAGWPSLMVAVCFLGGVTIFCQGVIGIYLSKIFIETKRRPYAIIRDIFEHPAGGKGGEPDQDSPQGGPLL